MPVTCTGNASTSTRYGFLRTEWLDSADVIVMNVLVHDPSTCNMRRRSVLFLFPGRILVVRAAMVMVL